MFHPSGSEHSGTVLAAAMTPFVLWGAIRHSYETIRGRDPEGPLFVLSFTFSSHRKH